VNQTRRTIHADARAESIVFGSSLTPKQHSLHEFVCGKKNGQCNRP